MDKRETKGAARFPFDTVFSALLFCMFTVMALLLCVSGGRIYRSVSDGVEDDYLTRTALSYVAGKQRYDAACECAVQELGGENVLRFIQPVDGASYETRIWYSDGSLREIYVKTGDAFDSGAGTALLELDGFEVSLEGGLLTVSVRAGASERSGCVAVNAAKGGAS